ncbi:YaaC family protein [Pseudalkalibacillus berkeleyi]|uniref:YaaC family protein n=1 Tax=Pseudalkalibacillus berkeleyi TaxID=1069813 RepID=A0ABS9H3W7_9BACL|nr:YaaC family protein [Pseudalkalibacillus berkeleyi]MCF6139647.1 YaaC family protein [Pseudalkalibacillus berkeleyi]
MNGSFNEWNNLDQFLSTNTTQRYLKRCYDRLELSSSSDELSFNNSYSFIYYATHGKRHFDLCTHAPLELQPVLQYYGMVQLLKCCLLTVDPYYPSSTSLLAHGVTTRKRKKQNYLFLHDEIKVQRNGLFPYFSEQLFGIKQLEGDKFKMKDLLVRVPELNNLFNQMTGQSPLAKIYKDGTHFKVNVSILDALHMTEARFVQFLKQRFCDEEVAISFNDPFIMIDCKNQPDQLFYQTLDENWYCPLSREGFEPFHEVMVHYLLLYNLSMICRYETEWWGELFHTFSSNDFPFISRYLTISRKKVPYMLMQHLENQKKEDGT